VVMFFTDVQAQSPRPVFSDKGGIVGFGYGINNQNIPEGRYTPVFLIGHFGLDLVRAKEKMRPQRFMLFFEPQINPVVLQKPGRNGQSLEFGINVGLQHLYPLSRNLYVYALISTGPQVITVRTDRQARGFIFSDNMGAGTYFLLGKKMALNTGFRIRHMSNANLEMPNHGINTMNFFVGVSRFIR
jgi:hypothetical protein